MMLIIWTTIALLAIPLIVLRGRTLATYYAVDAATWLFAWLLWRRLPGFDPYLGCTAVAVVKLATFSLFLARGTEVRWSANRAAVIAGIIYAVAIPAMLRTPIDGDEPFYLLVTESIVHDHDLDLANQYRSLDRTASGRTDLVPQFGDPTGAHGERYSRHEPLLPLLMAPGYAVAGLPGAIATIALFGMLLVRSTVRWMEDEGISDAAARAVIPLFAFGPPVLFFATRIWPEVPAAFLFVEGIRGMREQRPKRWIPALLGLVLLKLRFILVAVGLVAAMLIGRRGDARFRRRATWIAAVLLAIPLIVMWLASGSATSVHSWREALPGPANRYAIGFFGLLLDGMSGVVFQAPFYLLGLFALVRWRATPRGFRAGMLGGSLYVLYLLPRIEWFGGWAPPLRYIVFLMPVLALGAAALWERFDAGVISAIVAWTIGLVIHGVAYPWRLFHIANGENAVGEWLSSLDHADFSRLFPSFIRLNFAAWVAAILLVAIVALSARLALGWGPSRRAPLVLAAVALAMSVASSHARQPATVVELEDAHVIHRGGELDPKLYTMMRAAYRCGWLLHQGESVSFLARGGTWTLEAITGVGATIAIEGRTYRIEPDARYQKIHVAVPKSGRTTLRCLSGAVSLDRMKRNE